MCLTVNCCMHKKTSTAYSCNISPYKTKKNALVCAYLHLHLCAYLYICARAHIHVYSTAHIEIETK